MRRGRRSRRRSVRRGPGRGVNRASSRARRRPRGAWSTTPMKSWRSPRIGASVVIARWPGRWSCRAGHGRERRHERGGQPGGDIALAIWAAFMICWAARLRRRRAARAPRLIRGGEGATAPTAPVDQPAGIGGSSPRSSTNRHRSGWDPERQLRVPANAGELSVTRWSVGFAGGSDCGEGSATPRHPIKAQQQEAGQGRPARLGRMTDRRPSRSRPLLLPAQVTALNRQKRQRSVTPPPPPFGVTRGGGGKSPAIVVPGQRPGAEVAPHTAWPPG